jgi:predicted Zn-dependent protease
VDEQSFGTIYGKEGRTMNRYRRKRFTLMPLIALSTLSLMVTLPALSATRLYAASPTQFASVTVRPGDSLWTIATAYTADGGNVQDTIDRIVATNHLDSGTIVPGEHLQIPH